MNSGKMSDSKMGYPQSSVIVKEDLAKIIQRLFKRS